jgi:hypothetical protein
MNLVEGAPPANNTNNEPLPVAAHYQIRREGGALMLARMPWGELNLREGGGWGHEPFTWLRAPLAVLAHLRLPRILC